MKRLYVILPILFISMSLYAEESTLEVKTKEGTFSVRISSSDNSISATMLSEPENIRDRLMRDIRELRNEYISKLYSRKDRREAMAILDEMEDLINLLYRIGFSGQVNMRGEVNVNIEDEGDEVEIGVAPAPTDPASFDQLLDELEEESFSDDKLDILKTAARTNYFTVDQLCQVMDKFDMDDDKVKAVRIVYPHVIDRENSHKLLSKVTFSDAKRKIRQIIESYN